MEKKVEYTKRILKGVYLSPEVFSATEKYLQDIEKQNPGMRPSLSRLVESLLREELTKKGYLKQ